MYMSVRGITFSSVTMIFYWIFLTVLTVLYFLFFIFIKVHKFHIRVRVMVLNATFSNISAISWWSNLLVGETGVPGGNHRPTVSY